MVTIQFQCPDFNEERNGKTASAYDTGVTVTVTGFDLDFSVLTVYPPSEAPDLNLTLAKRAPYMNEDGQECGEIGWVIQPEAELLDYMPELRQHAGKRYGRVLVFATEKE